LDRLMACSTSDIATSWSRASFSSREGRAIAVSSAAAGRRERALTFGAARRFGAGFLRGRRFGSLRALERFAIAYP
jgi:hypothetical protein